MAIVLKKKDYEELRRRFLVFENEDILNKPLTVVYDGANLIGILAPYTFEPDLKKFERRKKPGV